MIVTNPPLRVGQSLAPRPGRKIGPCKITGYTVGSDGLRWQVANAIGDVLSLTLTAVYALFVFDGQNN